METVIRAVVMYLFLLAALRIMGKREFGQLSPLELVTLLLIPEVMQQALIRDDFSITNAIISASTLLMLTFLTSLITHRNPKVARLVEGVPVVLVEHGQILADSMNRERVTPDEIFAQMHQSGLEQLKQVRWAILQTDGRIAIISETDSELTSSSHETGTATK